MTRSGIESDSPAFKADTLTTEPSRLLEERANKNIDPSYNQLQFSGRDIEHGDYTACRASDELFCALRYDVRLSWLV